MRGTLALSQTSFKAKITNFKQSAFLRGKPASLGVPAAPCLAIPTISFPISAKNKFSCTKRFLAQQIEN